MFEKFSNKQLLFLLFLLISVIIGIKLSDFNSVKKSFQHNLFNIDTSRISAIYIYPEFSADKELVLYNDLKDKRWELKEGENIGLPIDKSMLNSILEELATIQKNNLHEQDETNWEKFNVDSSGTKVVLVYDFDKLAIELVVGEVEEQTYLRVLGEERVYALPSNLANLVNRESTAYQTRRFFSSPKENWIQLSYQLPAFSSYSVHKIGETWYLDSIAINKEKSDSILSIIDAARISSFFSNKNTLNISQPDLQLRIKSKNGKEDSLNVFIYNDKEIITSSANKGSFTADSTLFKKLFYGKSIWIKP